MPERAEQPQLPPLVRAVEATKQGLSEKIENNPSFKSAVAEIVSQLGQQTEETKKAATGMVKSGTSLALQVVGLLPVFSNPEKKKEVLEKFREDKVEGIWVDLLTSWDPNSDPNGTSLLEACMKKTTEDITQKAQEAKDENQKKQLLIHASANRKGHQIVINFFKNSLGSNSFKKAA